MDKIKMTKKEFDEVYEIQENDRQYATDTSEDQTKVKDIKVKDFYADIEETSKNILTEEEQAQDKALEEVLGWDSDFQEEEK